MDFLYSEIKDYQTQAIPWPILAAGPRKLQGEAVSQSCWPWLHIRITDEGPTLDHWNKNIWDMAENQCCKYLGDKRAWFLSCHSANMHEYESGSSD